MSNKYLKSQIKNVHDGSSFRNSNVTWIDESDKDGALPWPELTDHIAKQVHSINNKHWGFDLSKC